MSPRRELNTAAFQHYMRVRIGGAGGPLGRLMRCEKKDGSGHYWKVRLDTGEWVWPDAMVLDGPGHYVGHCAECELPMLMEQPNGVGLCRYCDESMFGTDAAHAHDEPSHAFGRTRWNRARMRKTGTETI